MDTPHVIYAIDRDDALQSFNDTWTEFARANGAPRLEPSEIRGQPLWSFIAGPATAQLYRMLIDRLRHGRPPIRFRFRCDAPERRRLLAMDMAGRSDGGVIFSVTSVAEQARPHVSLLDAGRARGARLVTVCAWCRRIRLATGEWVEIEDGMVALGLFDASETPDLTHGVCASCEAAVSALAGLTDDAQSDDVVTLGALPVRH